MKMNCRNTLMKMSRGSGAIRLLIGFKQKPKMAISCDDDKGFTTLPASSSDNDRAFSCGRHPFGITRYSPKLETVDD